MKNDNQLPSLDSLQAKIDKVKGSKIEAPVDHSKADLAQAVRLSIDLAAGVLVGLTFGYLVDRWLGTTPWCMIVCLFLGMAAGVRNMVRSAALIDKKTNEQQKCDKR